MKKTGRNEPCPCGSGLKYKKCCLALAKPELSQADDSSQEAIITSEIAKLQNRAAKKKKTFKLIGAFVFFSTPDGDAWLLELTEQDALVVAKKGNPTETVIEETEETLQINWTHSFAIKGTSFVTTSYLDKSVETHSKSPAQTISDAIQQVSPDYTNQKH